MKTVKAGTAIRTLRTVGFSVIVFASLIFALLFQFDSLFAGIAYPDVAEQTFAQTQQVDQPDQLTPVPTEDPNMVPGSETEATPTAEQRETTLDASWLQYHPSNPPSARAEAGYSDSFAPFCTRFSI